MQILKHWDELRKLSCFGLGSGGTKRGGQERNPGNGRVFSVQMHSSGVEPSSGFSGDWSLALPLFRCMTLE